MRVLRLVTAHELGRVINPQLHQGQIEGALMQGFGYAMTEGLVLEDGRVMNAGLHEYKLPSIADLPPLETYKLPPDLSLGITPIGEGANCGMSAAIVNAIIDVVGQAGGDPRKRGSGAGGAPVSYSKGMILVARLSCAPRDQNLTLDSLHAESRTARGTRPPRYRTL